jgi:two-component sensor histidine kinase
MSERRSPRRECALTLEDLYRLLRTGHVQAQGIVDTIDQPVVVLDQTMTVLDVNVAFLRVFEVERDDTCGQSLFSLGNGQWDIPELRRLLQEVVPKAQAVSDYEVTHTFEQLGRRTMLVSARRLVHPDATSKKLLVAFEDITERRRSELAKDSLVSESQHRVKNFLTVVRALAQMTSTEGRSANEYREALLGRLDALIESQQLSISSDQRDVSVGAVVRSALKPFEEQTRIQTSEIALLSANQITPLRLILHEMTVNAAKYGALSVPVGAVNVTWEVEGDPDDRALLLTWSEEGGPPVSPTKAKGFGSRLISLTARAELGGDAQLHFRPQGLLATVRFPLPRRER